MTDSEIYDLVHTIVTLVTGLTNDHVIPADDNQESPIGSYASIKVGASRGQRGQANILKTNTDLVDSPIGPVHDINHNISAQLTVDVSVNFYHDNALMNAVSLFQANKRSDVSALLFAAGLGWRNTNAINDLTALQSKEREERAQITLTLLYEQSQSVITNAIYNVPIIAEDEDGNNIQTETIILEDAAALIPSDLPNLEQWCRYKEDITVDGVDVLQWDDQSGNDRHEIYIFGPDATPPHIESGDIIRFNGIKDSIRALYLLEQPVRVYALVRALSWTLGDCLFSGGVENTAFLQYSTTPNLSLYAGNIAAENANMPLNTWVVALVRIDSVYSSIRINNNPPTIGNAGVLNPGGITLGSNNVPSGGYSNVDYKEFFVFSGDQDASTEQQMIDYLANVGELSI